MRKNATLLLIAVLTVSSIIMVGSVFAESIPKPSVPEFTVNLVNGTVEVKIKNQPFKSYYDTNRGNTVFFYYNIRVKEHSSTDWIELYNPSDGFILQNPLSEYTEESYSSTRWGYEMVSFPSGVQVDFQVEAMIGFTHRQVTGSMIVPWVFTGETSGWSATQTLTIGESQFQTPPTTTPTPTSAPTSSPPPTPYSGARLTELEIIIGAAITVIVIIAGLGLLIYLIKRK